MKIEDYKKRVQSGRIYKPEPAYVRKELEQLATVFDSNDDLRTWLHTVFHTRIVRDGKRYVARIAPHDFGCQMCAFLRNNMCIPCVRIADEQGLSHLAANVYYTEY